jgi:hypothetical protein
MTQREIDEQTTRALAEWGVKPYSRAELDQSETFWKDHQPWLEESGYRLRPRYRPSWVPEWKGKEWGLDGYEDAQWNKVYAVLLSSATTNQK